MIRAVLDTSVLVPRRSREELQIAAQDGLYVALWSPWIIAELHRVLTWRWLQTTGYDGSVSNQRRCSSAAKAMMRILVPTFELVDTRPPYPAAWDTLSDEDDLPIWATAMAGNATHVVSIDRRHFPPQDRAGHHVYQGVEYMSARAFLGTLYSEEQD